MRLRREFIKKKRENNAAGTTHAGNTGRKGRKETWVIRERKYGVAQVERRESLVDSTRKKKLSAGRGGRKRLEASLEHVTPDKRKGYDRPGHGLR